MVVKPYHKDFSLIRSLDRQCFPEDSPPRGDGWWWVVWAEDLPVAYAGLVRSRQYPDVGYLCRAGVAESHRGRGLQRRLIRVRLKKAKQLGMVAVVTDTRQNPASANNLIHCGFRIYQPSNPWSFKDAIYWAKWL